MEQAPAAAAGDGGRWSASPPPAAPRSSRSARSGGVAKKRGGRNKSGSKRRRAGAQRQAAQADGGAALPAAVQGGVGQSAPGSAQRHRRGRAPRAHTPLARPLAPKNSSSFLMRCATLGLNAPLFSPPQSTPHEALGAPSSALRWPSGPPDVLDAGLGGSGPLAALLPGPALDPWGSNLDKIRRVDAPGAALPAASAAGDAAAAEDAQGDPLAAPLDADGGEVHGFRYLERGPQYLAAVERENEALRARLQAAEAELQRLRGAGEAEASVAAPRQRAATEATGEASGERS